MTVSFEELIQHVVSYLDQKPPRNLAVAFKAILAMEGAEAGAYCVEDLLKPLLEPEKAFGTAFKFGRLLWQWDHADGQDWCASTMPHTPERREKVYEILGLPGEIRVATNDRLPVQPGEKPTVIAEAHEAWYPPKDLSSFYWKAYVRHLRTVNNWPEESIGALNDSTGSVVERLSDPCRTKAYQSKGLVVGYVQSGKTANFTGVIAKAADAGYRLVIVLGGTLDILREQTQRRIDKELIGKELLGDNEYALDSEWVSFIEHGGLPSDLGAFDWQRLTGPSDDYESLKKGLDAIEFERLVKDKPFFNRENLRAAKARILVIKKHPAVMKRFIGDLTKLKSKLADVPALIIDDESDQASVNTVKQKELKKVPGETDRTATNRQITQLLALLPRAQYVGYTATPFANVFIDPSDEEDLFPKDFIVSLDRPAHYMGVADFYDLGDPPPAGFQSNERAFIRSVRGDDSESANLAKAIDSFILAGAMKIFREEKGHGPFKHHSMLVHRSQRKFAHKEDADLVRQAFDAGCYTTKAGLDRLSKLFENDFKLVSQARAQKLPTPSTFSELKASVGECIGRIAAGKSVRIVNGDNRDDTPDFDTKERIWSILVGGTKLSRGYTVEGLTVSYYRRTANAADTLMQMGRWFGYRRNYQDLVRLFIGRDENPKPPSTKKVKQKAGVLDKSKRFDLYEAFRAICLDEEEFRSELKRYASMKEPRITPKMIPPLVPSHLLRPTSANKMYNAKVDSENFGARWCDKTNAPLDDRAIRDNSERMKALLEGSEIKTETLSMVSGAGKKIEFPAKIGILETPSVLKFLGSYEWSGANPHLVQRQIDYLKGKHGDTEIDSWLLIAPQKAPESSKAWTAHDTVFEVRQRGRAGERYKVYTEPNHKVMAEYLGGIADATSALPNTSLLRRPNQAIFLFYPVRDEEGAEKMQAVPSMGFALLFPRNQIKSALKFSVHDSANKDAVTVVSANAMKAAVPQKTETAPLSKKAVPTKKGMSATKG